MPGVCLHSSPQMLLYRCGVRRFRLQQQPLSRIAFLSSQPHQVHTPFGPEAVSQLPGSRPWQWQELTRCSAVSGNSNDDSRVERVSVQQLQTGLAWEAQHGHANFLGRQPFSHFAAAQFHSLRQQVPLPLQKSACDKLVKCFNTYTKLPHTDRVVLVQNARDCLNVWTKSIAFTDQGPGLTYKQPQHVGPTSSPSQDISEPSPVEARQQSGAQASTSTAPATPIASNGASKATASPLTDSHSYSQGKFPSNGAVEGPALSRLATSLQADNHSNLGSASARSAGTRNASPELGDTIQGHAIRESSTSEDKAALGNISEIALPQPAAVIHIRVQPLGDMAHTDAPSHSHRPDSMGLQGSSAEDGLRTAEATLSQLSLDSNQAAEGNEAVVQPEHGKKKEVKPETAAFRENFALSAAAGMDSGALLQVEGVDQRSNEWMAMRDGRLTASTFANALGLFEGGRETLWAEKLGLVPKFAGNAATRHGTNQEAVALRSYEDITGQQVEACSFKVLRDDEVHGWLGASPDGLVQGLGVPSASFSGASASNAAPMSGVGSGVCIGEGPGILEIKCPFNRGFPSCATPPKLPQWYYMPQVQGLMDIFDRDWCNLYVWTQNGSTLFHIPRDKDYWRLCFQALAEFWWGHVIPAKHALARDDLEAAHRYRPQTLHASTGDIKALSQQMAKSAFSTSFPPSPPLSRKRRPAS